MNPLLTALTICTLALKEDILLQPEQAGYIEENFNRQDNIGLENLGNTCFMNASIQALLSSSQFQNMLNLSDPKTQMELSELLRKNDVPVDYQQSWIGLLQSLLRKMEHTRKSFITPLEIVSKMREESLLNLERNQEDENEFVVFLLYHINESYRNKSLNPFNLHSPFAGEITVEQESLESKKEYDFVLQLPIPKNANSLKECFDSYFQSEDIVYEGKTLRQHRYYSKPPSVLSISLTFYEVEFKTAFRITKKGNNITIPTEFNLKPYSNNQRGPDIWYDLISIIFHQGPTAQSGHYYAHVKGLDGKWKKKDDKLVSDVKAPTISHGAVPYMVFYEKRNQKRRVYKAQSEESRF